MSKQRAAVYGTLIDGLSLPASIGITTKLFDDKIEFIAYTGQRESEHQHFNLDIEKVQKTFLLSERQVSKIMKSSAPGMIIGAAAFGILGAMVGGRIKTKQTSKLNNLLFIEYFSNNESKQILINIQTYLSQAKLFVKKINKLKPIINQTVEL